MPYCFPVSAPKLSSTVHQHISEQTVSCFLVTCLLDNEWITQKETKCSSQLALSPSKSRCAFQQVPQKTILDKQYPKKNDKKHLVLVQDHLAEKNCWLS